MAQVGSHAYVPSMLQTGSQQLQVLTPTSNVLLTGETSHLGHLAHQQNMISSR